MDDVRGFWILAGAVLFILIMSIGTNIPRMRRRIAAGQSPTRWMRVSVALDGIVLVALVAVVGVAIIGG